MSSYNSLRREITGLRSTVSNTFSSYNIFCELQETNSALKKLQKDASALSIQSWLPKVDAFRRNLLEGETLASAWALIHSSFHRFLKMTPSHPPQLASGNFGNEKEKVVNSKWVLSLSAHIVLRELRNSKSPIYRLWYSSAVCWWERK